MTPITCFKAYDLRGRIPSELNVDVAYRVARGYAAFLRPKKVCVGRDIRLSSAELADAVVRGLVESGVEVLDIGLCGTEGVYFATSALGVDGGIMVTASHNPPDYNGMKFVREGSRPISADTGLQDIRRYAESGTFAPPAAAGTVTHIDTAPRYIAHLLSYVEQSKLRKLKIVCNAGNGGAGLVVDKLEPSLPFEFVKVHHQPDGTFPNGVPNPMLGKNHGPVIDAIRMLRHRGHDVIIFHVLDEAETNFPFDGLSDFEDPESGERLIVDAVGIRGEYLEALGDLRERYKRECLRMGADYVPLDTSMPFDRALVEYLSQRKARF